MEHKHLAQLQAQLADIPHPFFVGTLNGQILFFNEYFGSALGYEVHELSGISWKDHLTPAEQWNKENQYLSKLITNNLPCHYNKQFIHRRGYLISTSVTAMILPLIENLQPLLFLLAFPDRENDSFEPAVQPQLYEEPMINHIDVLNSVNVLFYTYDLNGRITYINNQVLDLLGYQPYEIQGRNLWEFVPEKHQGYFIEELQRRIKSGKKGTYLNKIINRDGVERIYKIIASPIIWNDRIVGEMALGEDITEARHMEKALRQSNDRLLKMREELVAANQQLMAVEEELRAQLEESEQNRDALTDAHQRLETILNFLPDPTYVIDRQGRVLIWNHAMEELTGLKVRDMLGRDNLEYAVPFFGRRLPMLIDMALNPENNCNHNILIHKGENDTLFAELFCPQLGVKGRYLSCKSSPLRDRSGNLVGAIETIRDVTERKQAEKALFESEQKYRNMIERLEDGYFEVDLEGNFTFINRYLGEKVGYRQEELLGKNYSMVMDEANANRVKTTFNRVYRTGKPMRDFEWYVKRRKGGQFVVESTVLPIKDNDVIIGFRGIVSDVTDRKKAEEALQISESNLRKQVHYLNTLINNLHEMFFTYDLEGRMLFVNKKAFEVVGYHPEEMEGVHISKFVVPAFREQVYEGIRTRIEEGRSGSYELPIIHKNGSERIIKLNASPLFGDNKQVVGGMVLAEDITERKRAQQALEISEAQYRAIVEDQTELICRWLPDRTLTFVNEAYCRFFQKTRDHILEERLQIPVHPDDKAWVNQKISYLSPASQSCTLEYRVIMPGGIIRWLQCTYRAIFDVFENVIEYQSVGRDITEQKSAQERLTFLSQHDSLTGLYNRLYFEQELKRLEGTTEMVGLIMCDVDGLKLINDTLGHDQGDRLLRVVSNVMKTCFRGNDILARVGGDEFAAIIPHASIKLLEGRIEAIRAAVQTYNEKNHDFPISVSLGYAYRKSPEMPVTELFKEADNNMYREKLHSGRSDRNTIIHTLIKSLEFRDYVNDGHIDRLQSWTEAVAREIGLPDRVVKDLRLLAQFHDIGKVGVPDFILFKTGLLNEEEQQIMQRHCEIGHRIALSAPELLLIADWILKHHEWWNGKGYPLGLCGEEIPLECRIITIADAFDAMTNDRPYRKAMSWESAIDELKRYAGIQFDPQLVEVFIRVVSGQGS